MEFKSAWWYNLRLLGKWYVAGQHMGHAMEVAGVEACLLLGQLEVWHVQRHRRGSKE